MLLEFQDEDFEKKIKNEDVSVIQFSAAWCGPCKALKPVMDKLSDEYKEFEIVSGFNQPLRTTNKEEMLEDAKQLGFDELLYYTWTCWYPKNDEPCNECKMCKERIIECRNIGDTI